MKRKRMVLIVVTLIVLVFAVGGIHAQGDEPPKPQPTPGGIVEKEKPEDNPAPHPSTPPALSEKEEPTPSAPVPDAVQGLVDTAFTYQGSLLDNGMPVNDICNFTFTLWDAESGGNQIGSYSVNGVSVEDGLFTVALDFGEDAFKGDARWLEAQVDCGSGTVTLSPRQPLKAAPYALSLRPGANIEGASGYGLGISNTGSYGLYVWDSGADGVTVTSPGGDGLEINDAGDNGISIFGSASTGIDIYDVGGNGIYVEQTPHGYDGLHVYSAGSPSSAYSDSSSNGVEIEGAEGYGVYVGHADHDGVWVNDASDDGIYISNAGDDGIVIENAGYWGINIGTTYYDGIKIGDTGDRGVEIWDAGTDGVYVGNAGNPSTTYTSDLHNGIEVAGAEGHGVYVGRADQSGVVVNSAGADGIYVGSADTGLWVDLANYGVFIADSYWDGVVAYSDNTGVYGSTDDSYGEWGVYTPDKIYAGGGYQNAGPMSFVAQNGDSQFLEKGDVIVVSGVGASFGESNTPLPLVVRASGEMPVFGVVVSKFVLTEKTIEVNRDGKTKQVISQRAQSVEGPAQPGEFVLVTVLGPAQVKADALSADMNPGALVAVGQDGRMAAASAQTPFGRILGTAMEAGDADGDGFIWVMVNPR